MSRLFTPLTIGSIEFKNRAWVPPMCQYSATDGLFNDWHGVHYASMFVGGYGLAIVEATAVLPEGRISAGDLGLWNDEQAAILTNVPPMAHKFGAKVGIQLAHAGRKASCVAPWRGGTSIDDSEGGWQKVAPSAVAFEGYHEPRELSITEIREVIEAFAAAARRAVAAGFDVIEIHSAHGYLLHEFLSPISNKRTDEYGGSLENRMRLLCEVASAVRVEVPQDRALFVRLSATDWVEGGWDVEQSCAVVRELHARGVEFIDVSSGGLSMAQDIKLGPGYQVDFARTIAQETGMPVSAVGMITTGAQAEEVLADGTVEAVMIGRSTLGNSRWPYQAAKELGDEIPWPDQYARGFLAR